MNQAPKLGKWTRFVSLGDSSASSVERERGLAGLSTLLFDMSASVLHSLDLETGIFLKAEEGILTTSSSSGSGASVSAAIIILHDAEGFNASLPPQFSGHRSASTHRRASLAWVEGVE